MLANQRNDFPFTLDEHQNFFIYDLSTFFILLLFNLLLRP